MVIFLAPGAPLQGPEGVPRGPRESQEVLGWLERRVVARGWLPGAGCWLAFGLLLSFRLDFGLMLGLGWASGLGFRLDLTSGFHSLRFCFDLAGFCLISVGFCLI